MKTNDSELRVTTEQMLRHAFPSGVSKDEYCSLLWLMDEAGMSHRSIADAMDKSRLGSWPTVYNDVLGVLSEKDKYAASGRNMIGKLKPYGYDVWIERLHDPL